MVFTTRYASYGVLSWNWRADSGVLVLESSVGKFWTTIYCSSELQYVWNLFLNILGWAKGYTGLLYIYIYITHLPNNLEPAVF